MGSDAEADHQPTAIARLLKRYDIKPGNVGPRDNRAKGYRLGAFDDAWKRYGGGS